MSTNLAWVKSSHSGTEGGNCIEVAPSPSAIHVRDSKDKTGPTLTFSPSAWSAFVALAAEAQVAESE
ncbi:MULTISPECIES: DUF397 domain-containing protein [Streptomyces]|uniref:DUF397 domain-containing protein n=1 Tax=Streptomyces TaxID=1883 RepID=UPI0004AA3849|nr:MULTISPECIES: DUF397 domain-containing protein [Streptomyces]